MNDNFEEKFMIDRRNFYHSSVEGPLRFVAESATFKLAFTSFRNLRFHGVPYVTSSRLGTGSKRTSISLSFFDKQALVPAIICFAI